MKKAAECMSASVGGYIGEWMNEGMHAYWRKEILTVECWGLAYKSGENVGVRKWAFATIIVKSWRGKNQ